MASNITILVHAHLITIYVESFQIITRRIEVGSRTQERRHRVRSIREIPPGQSRNSISQLIERANNIWSQADITFSLQQATPHRVQAPNNRETINANGFLYLARQYPAPARSGINLLLIFRFAGDEGGQAIESQRVCIVRTLRAELMGRVLAHEFGHLLSLEHMEEEGTNLQNLMRPGLVAGNQLTEPQIRTARNSKLATRFSQARSRTRQP